MSSDIIRAIRVAALEAMENSKPCDLRYGTVISVSPLKIRVTDQFILPASSLIVPEHLTDYEIETTILQDYGWSTQTADAHSHTIKHTRKKIKIHGALREGDKVALLRQSGGQFYFVLDRLKGDET